MGEALIRGGRLPAADCPAHFSLPTALTAADETVAGLAQSLPDEPLACALEASRRIRDRVDYCPGATTERTTAIEALNLGAGVCQDFAHLLMSVLHLRGVPARYVAGLIPGEGATHAWVELFDGAGFVGVDPTHLCPVDDRYLRVSAGRDGRDCAINRGMFIGAAQQVMDVLAQMIEI